MDIRFVLPEEVRQLQRNVLTAFPSKTPASLLQNMESELYQPDEGRYLGCFDDNGTLIGSILMMDFTLNVRGVMMPMGAAAYVSTNFLHKKEHIARNMLRVLMGYYTKLGTTVGCLHPFNPAFYRKMGYGHCMEAYFYMPKASEIRSFGHKEGLCYAEEGEPRGSARLLSGVCTAHQRRDRPSLHGPTPHFRHALCCAVPPAGPHHRLPDV